MTARKTGSAEPTWTPELLAAKARRHEYRFPAAREYALDDRCPQCKAEAGTACPGKIHRTRMDADNRHYYRDVDRAPWPEDRVPGTEYHSLEHVTRDGAGWPEVTT